MKEYKSPFLLPPKCNDPAYAKRYPTSHKNSAEYGRPRCPVHCKDKEPPEKEWLAWSAYREAFATIEPGDTVTEKYFLNLMLDTVTATNPPDAPSEPEIWMEMESRSWYETEIGEIAVKAWEWAKTPPGVFITTAIWLLPLMVLLLLGVGGGT